MVNIGFYVNYLIVLILCTYVFTKTGCYAEKTQDNDEVNIKNTKLRFVSMVFRHGNRGLDNDAKMTYPNNPYNNYSEYSNNGQLTNVGKRRAFQLGQMLKETYHNFLGDIYYPSNVYARSSAILRAKMTLQLVLAALYPPVDSQKWNTKLNWQPVDIIYTPISADSLLFPYICKEYVQAYVNILKDKIVMMKINEYNNLMKNLSKYVGKNITAIYELFVLYHILTIQSAMGLILPDWSRDIFPHGKFHDVTIFQYKLYNYNNKLIRLNGGVLLYKIIEDMIGVANGTLTDRKINLYSAHDVNVVTALYSLGIYDNSYPDFTSGVIIELHEKDDKYFVRVLRYLGVPQSLKAVRIPHCDMFCPLQKFIYLRSLTTATREDPNCPLMIPIS